MSSHNQIEPAPLCSGGDLIDQLIYQALLDDFGEAEPSSQVWHNICQRITATGPLDRHNITDEWISLLWGGAQTLFNLLFGSSGWESRLLKQRGLAFWPLLYPDGLTLTV